ncbi:MAG: hypothetical protein Q9165_005104 [Trypethelium subeluteriae]
MALGRLPGGSSTEKDVDSVGNAYETERMDGPRRMSRIDRPIVKPIVVGGEGDDMTETQLSIDKQMELEQDNAIKYLLGLVPGLILTVVVAALVLYTSLTVWEFCLRHPEVRDVCDIGQMLFWGQKWAWWFTGIMFILNNTFIQGFHCLVGSKYLNTMTYPDHRICTVAFSAIVAIVSFFASLPRTFSGLARLATVSALFTFLSVFLAMVFAGVESHPGGYVPGNEPLVLSVPKAGTTFIAGMNAFMNISYTFIGQITIPSFIAEMKNPRDFPKALWAVTIAEVIVFSLVGSIVYAYTGTQYNVSPAFGSLGNETFLKVSFSFMIPTIIFLGVLYASVSARFVFFSIFQGTVHMGSHTVVGWASWALILIVLWILAFIIAEVIPFFADLLSLMSSLFDSFFGFIFWGVAYLRMRNADYGPGFWHWKTRGIKGPLGAIFNVILIGIGLLFLSGGTYASVESIVQGYEQASFGGPFTCDNNGLLPYTSPT